MRGPRQDRLPTRCPDSARPSPALLCSLSPQRSRTISAERRSQRQSGSPLLSEFRYGTWSRSFRFPQPIEREQLQAVYCDGLLTVTAPNPQAEQHDRVDHLAAARGAASALEFSCSAQATVVISELLAGSMSRMATSKSKPAPEQLGSQA